MGAVSFSLDPRLVKTLQAKLRLDVFVETGTFKGDTVANLESHFNKLISVELSEALWAGAVSRFIAHPKVTILQGDSPDKLRDLKSDLKNISALYWLDAHWCVAMSTAGGLSQCPLLRELQAIEQLNSDSVVLIDDARLFLAPPLAPHEISHWPSFHQIAAQLFSMSSDHELMVLNDVILFYPQSVKAELAAYAQNYGVDWLKAMNVLKDSGTLIEQLESKERVIQEKEDVLLQHEEILLQKQSVIDEQAQAIKAYKAAFWALRPLLPVIRYAMRVITISIRRCLDVFRPRIGNLNQYSPRPLGRRNVGNSRQLIVAPKISIVTPSLQQGQYLKHTIDSVLNQGYPNLEYFIQDGESTDETIAILKQYQERLSGWISEKDSGQSQAINRAFAHTNGEIMGWLNSDDILMPGALNCVADYFNRHPEVDVIYGNRLLIDESGMEIGRWILPRHETEILSWVDFVPQETMFWRRRIWNKIGAQIDETFRFAMDWDLLVRFRESGAKFAHIPHFLGAFRIHEFQKTSAALNRIGLEEMDRIRTRVLGRTPSRKEIRKAITPFLIRHIAKDIAYRISNKLGAAS